MGTNPWAYQKCAGGSIARPSGPNLKDFNARKGGQVTGGKITAKERLLRGKQKKERDSLEKTSRKCSGRRKIHDSFEGKRGGRNCEKRGGQPRQQGSVPKQSARKARPATLKKPWGGGVTSPANIHMEKTCPPVLKKGSAEQRTSPIVCCKGLLGNLEIGKKRSPPKVERG